MSAAKRDARKSGDAKPSPAPKPPAIEFKPPLQPHKKLFIVLLVIFAIWVAALVGMYVKTVYQPRHASPATTALP